MHCNELQIPSFFTEGSGAELQGHQMVFFLYMGICTLVRILTDDSHHT